jgi:homoserine dehydrogenase
VSGSPLRVAILGAGTVGRQVVLGLVERGDRLATAGGRPIVLVGVAVRDVDAAVARGLPADLLTDAPAHLVAAPDTDVIIELMGGDDPALTLLEAALQAGKGVVTANKHLLAHHGARLEAIARRTDAPFRFEAAVGGGIPVLSPLAADLGANRITSVRGIVNGTTNHILSAMAAGEGTYEAVLRDAQERGYAEADPSGDVEGRDAINKLVVLARLAFDTWLDPAGIHDRAPSLRGRGGPGITGVTAADLDGAAALGLAIRLIARAAAGADDDAAGTPPSIDASVIPTAVPASSALGATGGVRNRIEVEASPVGCVGFDGPGAGGEATSSAVLGDLVAIARGGGSTWAGRPPATTAASPTTSVDDPLSTDDASVRPWFALLPGARAGRVLDDLAEASADTAAGVAVRTRPVTIAELRERVLAAAPDTLDAQVYPIDA